MNKTETATEAGPVQGNWKIATDAYTAGNRAWLPTTQKYYHEMLGVMPPVYVGRWWGVGETWSHTAKGEELILFFRALPDYACRIATVAEIKRELEEIPNRLFIGVYPCGLVYADSQRERAGDYMRLAFLPYKSLALEWERVKMPDEMRKAIETDAARMAAMRGQQFRVSSSGQYVTLGQ